MSSPVATYSVKMLVQRAVGDPSKVVCRRQRVCLGALNGQSPSETAFNLAARFYMSRCYRSIQFVSAIQI